MDKNKKYFIAIITITLFGEMYFYPFQDAFRFSAGVLALSLALLLYTDLKEIYLGILTGLSVFVLRGFINSLKFSGNALEILKLISWFHILCFIWNFSLFYILEKTQ